MADDSNVTVTISHTHVTISGSSASVVTQVKEVMGRILFIHPNGIVSRPEDGKATAD